MKSSVNSKIKILIALGILFALSPMITVNLSFIVGNNNKSSEYSAVNNLDNKNLKISAKFRKIHIDGNSGWVAFKNAGNCTGEGTYSDPYIIEDLVIDAGGWGSCILIENSDVYFKIENCSVYNSRGIYLENNTGIQLSNVKNSLIITNNCTLTDYGLYLMGCNNNTISGNTVNNNDWGIHLLSSHNNAILGNTANNTYWGIYLSGCNNNSISGNTANNNNLGIRLYNSYNNTLSGNSVYNNRGEGIELYLSNYNTVSGNTANNNLIGIKLSFCYYKYNTVSGNTANRNTNGIFLFYSSNNTVSGNTANNNLIGIKLYDSNYNTISGNTLLGNDECIEKRDCEGNIFENNDCGIPIELIILISVVSGGAVIGIATLLLIRHKRKRIQ